MKFTSGTVVATKGVHVKMINDASFSKYILDCFTRYMNCDWGDTCKEDSKMNDSAVKNDDDRIMAKYNSKHGDIFIITEYDRSATTILFADEY